MTANAYRGEVLVTLAGEDYLLRPTFQAIAAIEAATGRGIYALAEELHAMLRSDGAPAVGAREVVAVLHAGLDGAGAAIAPAAVGDIAMRAGLVPAATAAFAFLVAALTGPRQ